MDEFTKDPVLLQDFHWHALEGARYKVVSNGKCQLKPTVLCEDCPEKVKDYYKGRRAPPLEELH